MAAVCAGQAAAQTTAVSPAQIETLRGQVEAAANNHASEERQGMLWMQLANAFEERGRLGEAEEAFGHALSLLRGPTTQAAFADALDGLGSVYTATGQLDEAQNCLEKARTIFNRLGAHAHAASAGEGIAVTMLMQGRKHDGERESAAALKELEADPQAGSQQIAVVLLTHSYALCLLHRCEAALEDVDRAAKLVRSEYPADSVPSATVLLARGYDQWKAGALEAGEQSMREALRIATSLNVASEPLAADVKLNALQQYESYLKATHRKPEAKEIEDRLAQARSGAPPVCVQCSVNVNALFSSARH